MGFLRDIMDKLLGASPDSRRPLTVQRSGQPKSIVSKEQVRAVADIVHPLEGHELDDQQLSCIACDAHSQLVLAGAGTGKTTTIVGLIKYLLKSETCSPTDILALSYTHASAEELGERVRSETGQTLEVMTFHKLGLEIIKRVTGKKPTISQVSAMEFSRDELKRRLQDPVYSRRMAMYLHNARYRKRTSRFEVSSQEEYERLLRENAPITIRGESVKSFGEVAIANFLYYNGIDYEYERPYEYDTSTDEYGQYHPDFYLKPYGVYIEFLAIDKNGQVPAYFKGKDGKSGTQTYLDSLSWKRRLHREKGTDCIELYAYQEFDDTLIEELKEQLKVRQIDLRPVDPELLWKELGRKRDDAIDSVASLFGTLISLLKSTGMTSGELKRRCANRRALFLLSLLDPVYQAYQEMLAHNDQIDFDDMINLARKYVDDGLYRHQYRFVIIDEYQDISASRQGLVQALRAQSDFRLFCVGDDWQSIYRFSGSDIGFILNFEDQWGPSVINKIETTRRFPQKLIDVSGIFVMTNPHQTKKQLRSTVESALLPLEVVCGYTERKAMEFAAERMAELPKGSTVLLLGRYHFDARMVSGDQNCQVEWNAKRQVQEVHLARRPDLDIVFRTIHQSKGLEADYVFVLNNRSDGLGFPSRVEDDPLVELLLSSSDDYPYAEERRLFYVALTRARKKVFLITLENRESCFVGELRERWGDDMGRARYQCPRCGGRLSVKEGTYSRFLGCENYRVTGCTFKRTLVRKSENAG